MDGIEVNNEEKDARSEWREKHRLGKIVKEISVGRRSNFWTGIFIFFLFVFCAIFLSATVLGADEGVARKMYFASKNEFVHEGSGSLNYASCSLTNNILKSPDGDENSFADFTFLSTVAYLEDAYALDAVTEWFDTDVNNLEDIVSNFKRNYQHENGISSVKYKLFEFPSQDLKIVSIRGTSNSWDTLTDAQLWSSAALAQYIRAFLPIGNVWTPILPHLIKAIAVIEDESLRDVSYYRETTAFVEFLKVQGDNVQVVGHCEYSYCLLSILFASRILFVSQNLFINSSWWWASNDHRCTNRDPIYSFKWSKRNAFKKNILSTDLC